MMMTMPMRSTECAEQHAQDCASISERFLFPRICVEFFLYLGLGSRCTLPPHFKQRLTRHSPQMPAAPTQRRCRLRGGHS